jgi:hypothetical protein
MNRSEFIATLVLLGWTDITQRPSNPHNVEVWTAPGKAYATVSSGKCRLVLLTYSYEQTSEYVPFDTALEEITKWLQSM